MTRFSVIAVDYEFHVPRPGMLTGLNSLANQTFKDFELIYVHDGPKNTPIQEEFDFNKFEGPVQILNTETHMKQWGHHSRDLGMRNATGEFFIQFNIDNVFYPEAFQTLDLEITNHSASIAIFSVKHFKAAGGNVFTGIPPTHCNIDAMQLVAHRNIWENMGYWYTYEDTSDGIIYQKMCETYPYIHIPQCLGENY